MRRHLGSRLLTARAALSNSLQSRPPTPGPAPGPWPPGPSAPPCAAVHGADSAQALPSGPPVQGSQWAVLALAPHALIAPAARGADVSLQAPPPRLQGNRGFRLLLWEPEVTVYSHGRPAARPRSPPRRVLSAWVWADAEKEEAGGDATSDEYAGVAGGVFQRAGLQAAAQPLRHRSKQGPPSV